MRILFLTNMFPFVGDVPWRGIFLKEQLRSLYQINKSNKIKLFLFRGKTCGGSNFIYLSRALKLKKILANTDVVHCHHWLLVLMVQFFNSKIKIIYTIHEESSQKKFTLAFFMIEIAKYLSNHIIYVNKTDFYKCNRSSKSFLPCGVNQNVFFPSKSNVVDNTFFFPADPSRLGKRFDIFEGAFRKLQKSGVRNLHYRTGGNLSKNAIAEEMRNAKVLITIGKYESDGLVVKEGLLCGCVIVASSAGNAPYYASLTKNIIIWDGSVPLESCLLQAVNLYDRRETDKNLSLYQFTLSASAVSISSLYDKLA